MIDASLAAYFAGFFDGEGSVYAASRGGTKSTKYRRPSATVLVCITNTNFEIMEFHRKLFGGSLHVRKAKGRQRAQMQWVLCSRQAKVFLEAIRPYLVIKRDVVDEALNFISIVSRPYSERLEYKEVIFKNGRYWSSPKARPEYQAEVMASWKRIRELNVRGAPFNALRASGVEH